MRRQRQRIQIDAEPGTVALPAKPRLVQQAIGLGGVELVLLDVRSVELGLAGMDRPGGRRSVTEPYIVDDELLVDRVRDGLANLELLEVRIVQVELDLLHDGTVGIAIELDPDARKRRQSLHIAKRDRGLAA